MLVLQGAAFDPAQDADCPDGVLVDGIDVVHVVLHLRDDAAEVGNEAAEDAGVVHPPEGGLGIRLVRQHLEEQPVRFRILADLGVDQPQVLLHQAQRLRMNVEAAALRFSEQPNKPNRILVKGIGEIEGETVAVDAETRRRPPE